MAALSDQLLAPFGTQIAKLERLYVGPDGALDLLPFGLLHDATGHCCAQIADYDLALRRDQHAGPTPVSQLSRS
jgi:hypothetical protein